MKLRMPRGDGMKLTEVFNLLQGQIKARKMQPAVKEHRTMTGTQNEAVAIQPLWVRRIKVQSVAKKHRPNLGSAQWQAQVAGVALMDGIHGKTTGLIGCFGEDFFVHAERGLKQPHFLRRGPN